MTDDLLKRVWLHREGILPGFTRYYGVKHLVWYETHETREISTLAGATNEEMESRMEARND